MAASTRPIQTSGCGSARAFGEGLGLSAATVRAAAPAVEMQLLLTRARVQRLQRPEGAPSNAGVHDAVMAVVYPLWREKLAEAYSVPGEALAFFRAHGEENWDHASERVGRLARAAVTREQQVQLWRRYGAPIFRERMDCWLRANHPARAAKDGA